MHPIAPDRRISARVYNPMDTVQELAAKEDSMSRPLPTLVKAFTLCLRDLGVKQAYGIIGGSIAPMAEALMLGGMEVAHFRHEGGAAFAACEAYFTSGDPVAVFVTTGPGLLNALNGIVAARWEGAKLLLISGATSHGARGRGAFQETSDYTLPSSLLFSSGSLFHYGVRVEHPDELQTVTSRLASGFARSGGFVAHVSLPVSVQESLMGEVPVVPQLEISSPAPDPSVMRQCMELMIERDLVIWVGFGARNAASKVRSLAEALNVPVMSTPRAKGIFPEDHPLYLGVTGLGGHPEVNRYMTCHRPSHVLVLGSKLGEFSSFWKPELAPSQGFIHVDSDPEVFGSSYLEVPVLGINADVELFLNAALEEIQGRKLPVRHRSVPFRQNDHGFRKASRSGSGVRTTFLMELLQRMVMSAPDVSVMTDAGHSFVWGPHLLRACRPLQYRTSTAFGSMGHAAAGVVGAALAGRRKSFAVLGDGAMLMSTEVSTAVAYNAPAVWVVLNDGRYGMVEEGMRAQGLKPVQTRIPPTDFVLLARSMGASGVRVTSEDELETAFQKAMTADGPFVMDVLIDPTEHAPIGARIESLVEQENRGGDR